LTKFVQNMVKSMKKANPNVSFDLCHHNPYWAKRYFAADLLNWNVDRIFIQAYNEKNFQEELNYAQQYDGIAITNNQLARIPAILKAPKIKGIFIFPLSTNPEQTAANFQQTVQKLSSIQK
ncbi:MAG: family 10 glycosylhydrolase, partial [Microcystaceae cyanobacterium]